MSIYDVIANPQTADIAGSINAGQTRRAERKKEKTLMDIIDSTKDLKIKSANAEAQSSIDKAEASKRLADKQEFSNVMQKVKNADDYRNRIDTYFENRYPNLPEEERIAKLQELGVGPTFDGSTRTSLLNLEREVVNDVGVRQAKELADYEARLKLQLAGAEKGEGLKPESPRAKLAADVENYSRAAQQALQAGDIATATAHLNISNAAAKQLQEVDRSEQAATWAKESEEIDVSLGRVFPELAAMGTEDYKGPAADKPTFDAVQRDFKLKLEEYKSFPSAELAIQREWMLEPNTVEGAGFFSSDTEQLKFRRRTQEEIKEFDKNFFTLQTDADTASEMLQALKSMLQDANKGKGSMPLGLSVMKETPALMSPRK